MAWLDRYKNETILVCNEENHNKFWACRYDESTKIVHSRWGRIGTGGQTQQVTMANDYEAAELIDKKRREKGRKGYNPVDRKKFDEMNLQAAIVGTNNKCHSLRWVNVKEAGFSLATDTELQDPNCNPGIWINVQTKKVYDGRSGFEFLLTADHVYDLPIVANTSTIMKFARAITKSSPLYELIRKVEEAVGRSLA